MLSGNVKHKLLLPVTKDLTLCIPNALKVLTAKLVLFQKPGEGRPRDGNRPTLPEETWPSHLDISMGINADTLEDSL